MKITAAGVLILLLAVALHLIPEGVLFLITEGSGDFPKDPGKKKRIRCIVRIIGTVLNIGAYFLMHFLMRKSLGIFTTAEKMLKIGFTRQEILYLPVSVLSCTVFAVLLGIGIRKFLVRRFGKNSIGQAVSVRGKKICFGLFAAAATVSMLLIYESLSWERYIVLNEIQPNKRSKGSDTVSEDYVELYNSGKIDVSLRNLYLSDDKLNPDKLKIEDTVIPAGGYVLVHVGEDYFKLKPKGDQSIVLADGEGRIIDKVKTKKVREKESYGRVGDGGSEWAVMELTPGMPNPGKEMIGE